MTTKGNGSPDLALLVEGRHYDPHHFLGLHETPSGQVIRLWRPGAEKIYLEVLGEIVEAERVGDQGLFEAVPKRKISSQDYRIYHTSGSLAHDPYACLPTLGEMDAFLFNKGCHYNLYSVLGANLREGGTQFAVWAPNARGVSLIADFNHWDGRMTPMRSMGASGIWELFVPGIQEGEKYKFEIRTKEGYVRVKTDPVGFETELRPMTASIVADLNKYQWRDQEWKKPSINGPINVYEMHLGSWRYFGKEFPNYREIALDLAKYCREMGYTHVELLPIMEHPLDEAFLL